MAAIKSIYQEEICCCIHHISMEQYKKKREQLHIKVKDKYAIIGFISSGTYGRVYKACPKAGYTTIS